MSEAWKALLAPEIKAYMQEHESSDLTKLALAGPPNKDWPFALILQQIKLRQKAKSKLPEFFAQEDCIFISQSLLEQASSEACARYKASLFEGGSFCDLTSGHGVDSYFFAQKSDVSYLIECDQNTAKILQHNFDVLPHNSKIDVICADAEGYINDMPEVDFIYLDPQRRREGKKGLYELENTAPNVLEVLPVLKQKTKKLLLKTSPFLDIYKAIDDLVCVAAVHIVQYQGECKEVLYLLDFSYNLAADDIPITAVEINDQGEHTKSFTHTTKEEVKVAAEIAMPMKYIYEAGSGFMKSGGFNTLAQKFDLKKLHPQTHLYTADHNNTYFPGKIYEVQMILPAQAKDLVKAGIQKADLAVRNFPMHVDMLRKKLKLKDGGSHRIYASTLMDGSKKLIVCSKP